MVQCFRYDSPLCLRISSIGFLGEARGCVKMVVKPACFVYDADSRVQMDAPISRGLKQFPPGQSTTRC